MEDVLHTAGLSQRTRYGPPQPGSVIAGYRIERLLGAGGMGSVFLAKHPRLPRFDALKLLNSALTADEHFHARFEREADLAGSLDHRNIVTVYDRGEHDGQLWLSMRYVPGTDVARLLERQPGGLDPDTAVRIVTEVGHGLDYAHRRGLVHRDVKPANILLAGADGDDPSDILLTDFGIARALDDVARLTDTGSMLATIHYAAPEYLEGASIDGRADIYALGCTLYELLTGDYPFPLGNPLAIINAHLHADPPLPSVVNPAVPRGFDDVIGRALAKKPGQRYSTCAQLAAAARHALQSLPREDHDQAATEVVAPRPRPPAPRPAPASPPGRPRAPKPNADDRRTGRGLAIAVGSLVTIAAVAGVFGLLGSPNAEKVEWQQAKPVAAQFPQLLPENPQGTGWRDAKCMAQSRDTAIGITCQDSTGVTFDVWRTTDPAQRDALTAALRAQPTEPRNWAEGPVLVGADGAPDGWVLTEFYDVQRQPYLVVAHWPGHRSQQLLDSWWTAAPF